MSAPSSPRRGVTGQHTVRGVPHGISSITPYIGVQDTEAAARWYQGVFGARVVEITTVDGLAVHAQLDFGNGHLHLERPNPGPGLSGPPPDGAVGFALAFYCEDVAAVLAVAQANGAQIMGSPTDFASGDRLVNLRDPYGVRWSIVSRIEDLSEQDSAERVREWAARNRGSD